MRQQCRHTATRKSVVGIAALIVFLASAAELFALSRASASDGLDVAGLTAATRVSPLNWVYPYRLAEFYRTIGRSDEAKALYQRAVYRNPACARCLTGLAGIALEQGHDPLPFLARATAVGRASTGVRVRTGVLYARIGDDDAAATEFGAAIAGRLRDRTDYFRLVHRLYSAKFVLKRVIPDSVLPRYFKFACWHLAPPDTRAVWVRYLEHDGWADGHALYARYLLRHGLVHDAWAVEFGELDAGVRNPDFEMAPGNGAFDWRLSDGEGIKVAIAPCDDCPGGRLAVRLRFDGKTNVHYFGFYQTLPVEPRRSYRLSATVKAHGITSARGPSIAVEGVRGSNGDPSAECQLWVAGEDLRGSFAWRRSSLDFSVPANCDGVRLRIVRPRTQRLNRFIGGELWVDDVRLEELSPEEASEYSVAPASATTRAAGATMTDCDDIVRWGRRYFASNDHCWPVGYQLPSIGADEMDHRSKSISQSWRPFVSGVSIGG